MHHLNKFCAKHNRTVPEVLCRVLRGFRTDGPGSKREYTLSRLASDVFTGDCPELPDWSRDEIEDVLEDFPQMQQPEFCDTLAVLRRLGLANKPRRGVAR